MLNRTNPYYKQVELLVALMPRVAKQQCFALKGGTAINLFLRDLPRLSVDIDLAYLPAGDIAQKLAMSPPNQEYQWMGSDRRLAGSFDGTSSKSVKRFYRTGSCYET